MFLIQSRLKTTEPQACRKRSGHLRSEWPSEVARIIQNVRQRLKIVSGSRLADLRTGPSSFSILHPPHEFQPRPHLRHRADLYIHESCCQPNLAHNIFIQVRKHAGTLLRPTYPQHPRRSQQLRHSRKLPCQFHARLGENHYKVQGVCLLHRVALGQRLAQFRPHFCRSIRQLHAKPGLNPQFFRKWCPRISGH
jgi:hypothetical protein